MIRENVQGWLMDFNASEPVHVKEEIKVPLDLTRAQLERLTDWIADRIIEGNKSDVKKSRQ
jgi:hypothetical protein